MAALRLLLMILAACVAVMLCPPSAVAQCRLCEAPVTAPPDRPSASMIDLEVETSLDFDRLILLGDGEGVAVLRPDGSRMTQGVVGEIGPRAMVGTAMIRGEPNRLIRVELPTRISLHSSGGGRIDVDDVASDLPPVPRLDSAGKLLFRFGGRVRVTGEADGDYRGELPITVEYP